MLLLVSLFQCNAFNATTGEHDGHDDEHDDHGHNHHDDHDDHDDHGQPLSSYNWGDENVNTAIGWSLAAGLSTCIGGLLPFCPYFARRVPLEKFMGVSLAISAGVMLYITFTEIFTKAKAGINTMAELDAGGREALLVCLLMVGALLCALLSLLITKMAKFAGVKHEHICAAHGAAHRPDTTSASSAAEEVAMPARMSKALAKVKETTAQDDQAHPHTASVSVTIEDDATCGAEEQEAQSMLRAGWLMALIICLHNFPEGLAAFLVTVQEPTTGAGLAIGIILHNIPEGVAVAMPIYHATRSPCRALLWALGSGIAEPVGGLIGFAALRQGAFSSQANGIVFAIVGGMMLFVTIYELIPTAFRVLSREVATFCIFLGMFIMGLSFIILAAAGGAHDH